MDTEKEVSLIELVNNQFEQSFKPGFYDCQVVMEEDTVTVAMVVRATKVAMEDIMEGVSNLQ